MTTFELEKPEVLAQVKAIAQTDMEPEWEWGLEPYSRARPAPRVISPTYFRLIRHIASYAVYLTK